MMKVESSDASEVTAGFSIIIWSPGLRRSRMLKAQSSGAGEVTEGFSIIIWSSGMR